MILTKFAPYVTSIICSISKQHKNKEKHYKGVGN